MESEPQCSDVNSGRPVLWTFPKMLIFIQHRWTGLGLLIMGLAALTLFLYGFFPLKYQSGKLSNLDDLPNSIAGVSIDGQQVYNSGENTVVLMVIDGLRYDFLTEEYMPYSGQLLKNKSACIYTSVAEPPTVTMPKIKTMMTGSPATFADVALNFGAPAVHGDSVLRVAKARGRKSIMYGDDTWLKLFPELWDEYDGTSSFYVSDYTEVDNNVTRHLDKVLTPDKNKKPTFDFLVLHYLGLDHIGHLEGARSSKIKPKLLEMDEVVKKIYTAMQQWRRNGVLIVCADHGMRDGGGHGGATPSEVLVPLLLTQSNNFTCPHPLGSSPKVAQVDVAPSISWLLGASPPSESTGRILPALLPDDPQKQLYLLHAIAEHNIKQLLPKNNEFYKQFKRAEKQFAHFLVTGQQSAAKIAKEFYTESLEKMAEHLSEHTANFDLFAMGLAIVLLYMIAISLLCVALNSLQPDSLRKSNTVLRHPHQTFYGSILAFSIIVIICSLILTMACFISETKSQVCAFNSGWSFFTVLIPFALTITYFIIKAGVQKIKDFSTLKYINVVDYILIGGTIFHSLSFYGTSFIVQEYMTWYFYWNTFMFLVLNKNIKTNISKKWTNTIEVQEKPELAQKITAAGIGVLLNWILFIALHRYLRTINNSDDQWLNTLENSSYREFNLTIGSTITLMICLYNLRYMNNILHIHTIFTFAAIGCIFCYRIASKSLDSSFENIKEWDPVIIVTVFWAILIAQFALEIISYIGAFTTCGLDHINNNNPGSRNFDEMKLIMVRSASHVILNDMMLIVTLLMAPHNVIMVPSIFVTCALTSKFMNLTFLDSNTGKRTEVVDILRLTLVHLWIGILFFFYQGNSNSLATIDLNSGYVGLREYCPVRVALRMGLHAYAGPALAGAALFCTIAAHADTWQQYLQQTWRATNILALHRVYSVAIYCTIATIYRHHLFIWSVFSPKLLYNFVATLFSIQTLASIALIEVLTHVTNWLARIFTYICSLKQYGRNSYKK